MYKEAFDNHVIYKKLSDSIFNEYNSKQISDMKTRYEVEKKEAELKIKSEAEQAIYEEVNKRQKYIIYSVIGVLLIVITFSILLYKRFRLTNQQKDIIDEKNKEILDSIQYAKRTQTSLLPTEKYLYRILSEKNKNLDS